MMYRGFICLSVFLCFVLSSSFSSASNLSHSKTNFLKNKVPKGHDFKKVSTHAKYRQGHLLVRFASKTEGSGIKISEKKENSKYHWRSSHKKKL